MENIKITIEMDGEKTSFTNSLLNAVAQEITENLRKRKFHAEWLWKADEFGDSAVKDESIHLNYLSQLRLQDPKITVEIK